ncbi:hypothetical protein TNCV_3978701 [Trichonephila clavipes]|uniref:Uncharacterized protein n=1 Tax=Trichonephila clavipes TaxID=2585209 RepID=A0A8X7BKC3_TRICX|nr:hypothetical protein TNCV_3978701 [Trichonephila clavipes]
MSETKKLSKYESSIITGRHLCEKSDGEILKILRKANYFVREETLKHKVVEKQSVRPKNSEFSRRTLNSIMKQNQKTSWIEITQEYQSQLDVSASSNTILRE